MGRTQIKFIGEGLKEEKKAQALSRKKIVQTEETVPDKRKKKLSAKKEKGVRVPGLKGGERVVEVSGEPLALPEAEEATGKRQKEKGKKKKARGKKYLAAKAKVDSKKTYPPTEAVSLAKQTSFTKFDGSIDLTLLTTKPVSLKVHLPYFRGIKKKVEIASEKTIEKLGSGKIDFDVLYSTAEFMPQLLSFAKLLGPRGLLPNPKTGTIIKNENEVDSKTNTLNLKTEKEANIIHTTIGRVSQKEEETLANLETIVKALGTKYVKKATLNATQGPSIKLAVSS